MRTNLSKCILLVILLVIGVSGLVAGDALWRPLALAQEETASDSQPRSETAVVLKSLEFKSDFTRAENATAYLYNKNDNWKDGTSDLQGARVDAVL